MRSLVLLLVVLSTMASPHDSSKHQNGHQLEVNLRSDERSIFVIFWQMSDAPSPISKYNSGNNTEIKNVLADAEDVSYSVIDLSIEDHVDRANKDEEYVGIFELIHNTNITDRESYLMETGPIVDVLYKLKGVEVTGKDIAGEVYSQVVDMDKIWSEDKDKADAKAEADKEKAEEEDKSSSSSSTNELSLDDSYKST